MYYLDRGRGDDLSLDGIQRKTWLAKSLGVNTEFSPSYTTFFGDPFS